MKKKGTKKNAYWHLMHDPNEDADACTAAFKDFLLTRYDFILRKPTYTEMDFFQSGFKLGMKWREEKSKKGKK